MAHRSESHRLRYIDASRRASSVIFRAKSATWQATCSNLSPRSDPRAVFRLLNAISGKKNTSQDPSFPDCTCPLDTANHYASYLRSHLSQATPRSSRRAEQQFMNELRKASCEDASSLHNSFCSAFSLTELSTAISNLSSSTASGPDQIAYPLLKHLPEPAQLLLLSLFNRSWHSHTFPSCWKPTTIIPIHKPGKPTSSPSSFRPISLTSCISKRFECLILYCLTFHLESNHLLSTCQAGFRPGRSPLDQILTLSQSICVPNSIHATKPFAQLPLPLGVPQKNLFPYSTKPLSVRCSHMPLLDGSHSFATLQPITWKFYTEVHAGSLLDASLPPPSSLLLFEAQLPPLKLTLEHQTLYSFELALRLPPDFSSLYALAIRNVPCRLKKKPSWRSFCSSATQPLPSPRETLITCPPFPP